MAMLWTSPNDCEREEESSNRYSKLDARHFSTLSHSWCLQRFVIWLKRFDKSSVVTHTREKLHFLFFLKTSLTSWDSSNHGKKTCHLSLLLNFLNTFTRPSNRGMRAWRREGCFSSKLTTSLFGFAHLFPIQPSLSSAPGEQLYLLSIFSLDTQKENEKTKGFCLGKAGQKVILKVST